MANSIACRNNLKNDLLEAGFQSGPSRRAVPNVAEFVVLYLALQKIGDIQQCRRLGQDWKPTPANSTPELFDVRSSS